ncbi:hypothetical protein E2562_025011 [Oryza meyeriana var. granulata]|uniref:Uncharacterized protein n=1 Tax=Oryza meyeriana var. granulata TaxID=110450 RepID=A0A6G1FC76_9ORYZ|nr:hypothetical protein E2562_025011 [Oryza meyeriana var. granulata]
MSSIQDGVCSSSSWSITGVLTPSVQAAGDRLTGGARHRTVSLEHDVMPSRGGHRSRHVHCRAMPEEISSESSQTQPVCVIKRPSELPMLFIYDAVHPCHQDGVTSTPCHLAEVLL